MLAAECSHPEIKRWVINEDKRIGLLAKQRFLRNAKIATDGTCMTYDRHYSHIRHLPIILIQFHPFLTHSIATETRKSGFGMPLSQFPYEGGRVYVARRFSGYEENGHTEVRIAAKT